MRSVQVLSRLALKRLLGSSLLKGDEGPGSFFRPESGSCALAHNAAASAIRPSALDDCSQHLARAFRQANGRAWAAVEILLAGEEFWERSQLFWERDLEHEFFQPIRYLLDTVSLAPVDRLGADARLRARQSLHAALKSGLLTTGALEFADLSSGNGAGTGSNDADERLAEGPAIAQLTSELNQAGYADLAPLFKIECDSDRSLLIFLVGEIFRLAVENDADLFGDLAEACLAGNSSGVGDELRRIAATLHRYVARVDSVLEEIRETLPPSMPPPDPLLDGSQRDSTSLAPECKHGSGLSSAELVRHGDAHRLEGSYAHALADYTQALRLEPTNALALVQRGQVRWLMGRSEEALADYEVALQLDSQNAIAHYNRGKALANLEQFDAAIVSFSEVLRIDPNHAWAYHDLGEVYAALENHERAIANYCMAIRLNPLAALSYLRRAQATALLGEYEQAIADLDNALRLDPHNADAYVSRGTAHRELGKYGQAETDLTRALDLDFTSSGAYYERGLVFQRQGNHERALRDFDAAIYHNSLHTDAFCRRAQTHEALGNFDAALADLTEAVRLEPPRAAGYSSRGQIYLQRGALDLALADFDEAIRVEPALAVARLNRAKILGRLGRLQEALADCNQAVTHEPNSAPAYLARGSILALGHEYAAAVSDFSQALKFEPHNAQTYFLRGVAQKKLSNAAHAMADLSEAICLDPRHARAYVHRAVLRNRAGQMESALDDMAQATRLDGRHAALYCEQLGNLHVWLGNFQRAVADYSVALSLDPNNVGVRAALEQALKSLQSQPQTKPASAKPTPPEPPPIVVSESAVFRLDAASSSPPSSGSSSASSPASNAEMPASTHASKKLQPAEAINDKSSPERPPRTPLPARLAPVAGLNESPDTPVPLFVADEPAQFELAKGYNRGREEIAELVTKDADSNAGDLKPDDSEIEFEIDSDDSLTVGADDEAWRKEQQQLERHNWVRAEAQRKQLAEEMAKKIAEQKRSRMSSALAVALKAKLQDKDDDDHDDDGRMPLWKRGALAVAGLLLFYLMGSAAWGFFVNSGRTSAPTTYPVSGQVIFANGQPLPGGMLRLHPKDPPEREGHARLDSDGTFKVSSFGKDDGAPAGRYVVTIDPPPKLEHAVPTQFLDPATSPWRIEVTSGSNVLEPLKLQ